MKKFLRALLLAFALACFLPLTDGPAEVRAYAKSDNSPIRNSRETLFLKESRRIQIPASFKKPTFTTSNKWVATVSSTGVVTAKKEGTATIRMKYKKKTKSYKVTVLDISRSKCEESDGGELPIYESVLLDLPASFKNPTFKSSNAKVLTVDSRGLVTPENLGVATVVAKYKNKTEKFTFTVTPAESYEEYFHLEREWLFCGQKCQLKVVCDEEQFFDLSQVEWKVRENGMNVSESGYFGGLADRMTGRSEELAFYYGNEDYEYELPLTLEVRSEDLGAEIVWPLDTRTHDCYAAYEELKDVVFEGDQGGVNDRGFTKVLWDGKPLARKPDNEYWFAFEAVHGSHTLTVVTEDGYEIQDQVVIPYLIYDAVRQRDTSGYPEGRTKEFLEKTIQIVSDPSVIRAGMSDREKVKAVHDYIITHTEYTDSDIAEIGMDVHTAYGMLCKGQSVCEGYAMAFSWLMYVLDVPCIYTTGHVDWITIGHAWNWVLLEGKWYCIDCTWDDHAHAGATVNEDCYKYYLSETLWPDHSGLGAITLTASEVAPEKYLYNKRLIYP